MGSLLQAVGDVQIVVGTLWMLDCWTDEVVDEKTVTSLASLAVLSHPDKT